MQLIKIKKFSGLLLLIIILVSCGRPETKENKSLSPLSFKQKWESTPNSMLLDVRSLEEVSVERIKGEVNFDYRAPEFSILIKGLDKSKSYFIYCASGVRSANAAEKMKEEGFENVYTLEGGLAAWKKAGLPVQN
jgi:rhodanese-related sulfurtransferase